MGLDPTTPMDTLTHPIVPNIPGVFALAISSRLAVWSQGCTVAELRFLGSSMTTGVSCHGASAAAEVRHLRSYPVVKR